MTACHKTSWWIGLDQPGAWDDAVHGTDADVFHSAWFHRIAQARGEGTPQLFVWRGGKATVVLPLLLRDTPQPGGRDATSVYGYVGPASAGPVDPADVQSFQRGLRAALRERQVVCIFSRLHPLRNGHKWLEGLGQTQHSGSTVSVSLQHGEDARRASYRGSHRREVARLRRTGYEVHHEPQSTAAFHSLYSAAMSQLGASPHTLFSAEHIDALVARDRMSLFVVRHTNTICAAALFAAAETGAHYHLSATNPAFRKWAPSKLLIDVACDWAGTRGAPWMHLGGGVGGAQDSLFRFKAGFASHTHEFRTWRWILDIDAYRENCKAVGAPVDSPFFPAYRT